MGKALKIGLIGDQLPEYKRAQYAAVEMIKLAAEELQLPAEIIWVPTPLLEGGAVEAHLTRKGSRRWEAHTR